MSEIAINTKKAEKVLDRLVKYPLTTAWQIQEALEVCCPNDCEECYWKDLCCSKEELEVLNSL